MKKLAINGGKKVREEFFPAYITVGDEEKQALSRVIDSGVLSKYLGAWHEQFYGGPEVLAFEKEWAQYYGVKHAIAVNSATSAIYCAVGASGVGPGDEVVVAPYSMICSATAPLVYNAVPVFADIEDEFFCISPEAFEKVITPRTKVVIIVNILGVPYDVEKINAIAKKHNILVIEDASQSPGIKYKGQFAGTFGDMGIFSLNYHKHIHTGEGGFVVTNDDDLAQKVRLIRNHADAVVGSIGMADVVNMIGFNYRMTELQAAVGREQLKKLRGLIEQRIENVAYLEERLKDFPVLKAAKPREGGEHAYYVHAFLYNQKEMDGVHRDKYVEAVAAELMPFIIREKEGVTLGGRNTPLYMQPIFQKKNAYKHSCPFSCPHYEGNVSYEAGICPTVERLFYEELIVHELMRPPMTKKDIDDVATAFIKVWENRGELK